MLKKMTFFTDFAWKFRPEHNQEESAGSSNLCKVSSHSPLDLAQPYLNETGSLWLRQRYFNSFAPGTFGCFKAIFDVCLFQPR